MRECAEFKMAPVCRWRHMLSSCSCVYAERPLTYQTAALNRHVVPMFDHLRRTLGNAPCVRPSNRISLVSAYDAPWESHTIDRIMREISNFHHLVSKGVRIPSRVASSSARLDCNGTSHSPTVEAGYNPSDRSCNAKSCEFCTGSESCVVRGRRRGTDRGLSAGMIVTCSN